MKKSDLKAKFLSHRAELTKVEYHGDTFYLRESTVADVNFELRLRRAYLMQLAQHEGVELDLDDEKTLERQLSAIGDKYEMARSIAAHLCDQNGELLFNPSSIEDLESINSLPGPVLMALNKKIEDEPKN